MQFWRVWLVENKKEEQLSKYFNTEKNAWILDSEREKKNKREEVDKQEKKKLIKCIERN